ncbi:hypothetical protein CDIK_0838 [Cucumispora dikerogammari]|nr:hypothetical protein CDIK_0838 [Cucumispora dikerogammari]
MEEQHNGEESRSGTKKRKKISPEDLQEDPKPEKPEQLDPVINEETNTSDNKSQTSNPTGTDVKRLKKTSKKTTEEQRADPDSEQSEQLIPNETILKSVKLDTQQNILPLPEKNELAENKTLNKYNHQIPIRKRESLYASFKGSTKKDAGFSDDSKNIGLALKKYIGFKQFDTYEEITEFIEYFKDSKPQACEVLNQNYGFNLFWI